MQYVALLAFGCLILLNLVLFFTINLGKKLESMKLLAASFYNTLKIIQKEDPIYLRSVVNKLEPLPKEMLEGVLYARPAADKEIS